MDIVSLEVRKNVLPVANLERSTPGLYYYEMPIFQYMLVNEVYISISDFWLAASHAANQPNAMLEILVD